MRASPFRGSNGPTGGWWRIAAVHYAPSWVSEETRRDLQQLSEWIALVDSSSDAENERTYRYEMAQYSGTRRYHVVARRHDPFTQSLLRRLCGNGWQRVSGGRLHDSLRS